MTRTVACSLAFLLVGGIGAAQAVAAGGYRFEPRVSVGDVYEVTERSVLDLSVPAEAGTNKPATGIVMTTDTKTRREVLAEWDGQPTELRFTYLVYSFEMTVDGKKFSNTLPYAGRTFLVKRKDGKLTVTAKGGKLDKAAQQSFSVVLDATGPIRFPDVELAPGDDWDVPAEAATPPATNLGRTHAQFQEVADHQGEARARVRISKSSTVSLPQLPFASNVSMTSKLEGELHYSATRQRPIEMKLAGPISFTGTAMKDGQEFPMSGTGRSSETYSERWIKVAGKPVSETASANSGVR